MFNQFLCRGYERLLLFSKELLKNTLTRQFRQLSSQQVTTSFPNKMTDTINNDQTNSERGESSQPEKQDIYFADSESDLEISDFRETYSRARKEASNKWLNYQKSCYVYLFRGGGQPSSSIAAFDLDGTIIKPKSNKRIPRSATDWTFFSAWTKIKIQQAAKENQSRFVILTNQNGVGLKIVALEEIQERIELVTKSLNIPCTVFVATERDDFRKPGTKMFHLFRKCFNDLLEVDRRLSFYCGDAIGYPSHSDADIKFAKAVGLKFLTPEKFVRGVIPKFVE